MGGGEVGGGDTIICGVLTTFLCSQETIKLVSICMSKLLWSCLNH